jgi:hypothetical protein
MKREYEDCPPRPEALILSLRAFGYDLSMAIADLIDNSLFAKASRVCVDYDWNRGDPWFRIADNGIGMTEQRLHEAMRLGSQSPLEVRDPADLGRFGLGLKSAAFSQGKRLTVHSKTNNGKLSTRVWDLDHVCETGQWEVGIRPPTDSAYQTGVLDNLESGTVVLCEKLDRLVSQSGTSDETARDVFHAAFRRVASYLEIVFHRYLEGRAQCQISVGRHVCKPWDPFLERNEFTQRLSNEKLGEPSITVRPYVLPHVSKRSEQETIDGSGLLGWNAHQGFYVYRNSRLIIAGGYLDFSLKAEEHFKLCRIAVDLPNNLDNEWSIDVRKAAASPPPSVRGDLERIAKATRSLAAEVYRARSGVAHRMRRGATKRDVWLKRQQGGKVRYRINLENMVLVRVLAELSPPPDWIRKLFHLIETTVPHRLIIMDNAEREDCQVDLAPDIAPPPEGLVALCRNMFTERLKTDKDPNAAAEFVCSWFDDHPAYRAALDKMIEEGL